MRIKEFFQDNDITTQSTQVNTQWNSRVHPNDKQKNVVKVMLCMKFVATQTLLVMMHILVGHLIPYNIAVDNIGDLVTMEMIQQSSNK